MTWFLHKITIISNPLKNQWKLWHCLHICKTYFSIWLSKRQLDSLTFLYTQCAAICCSGWHLWWKPGIMHTGSWMSTFKVEPESVLGAPRVLRSYFENHWFRQWWRYPARRSCGPWGGDQAELRMGERWLGESLSGCFIIHISPHSSFHLPRTAPANGLSPGTRSIGMERS